MLCSKMLEIRNNYIKFTIGLWENLERISFYKKFNVLLEESLNEEGPLKGFTRRNVGLQLSVQRWYFDCFKLQRFGTIHKFSFLHSMAYKQISKMQSEGCQDTLDIHNVSSKPWSKWKLQSNSGLNEMKSYSMAAKNGRVKSAFLGWFVVVRTTTK